MNIMKRICTLLILLSTTLSNSQVTLLKNYNPKAQDLEHHLNSTKDSLILSSDKNIVQVDIFNEDFETSIKVENNNTAISLREIPIGEFSIEAKLTDKIVVMDIIKYDDITNTSSSKKEIVEGMGMMLDEGLKVIKSSPKTSIEFLLTRGRAKNPSKKNQKFYYTVIKINNGSSTSKTMRLVDEKSMERMVLKNKIEFKSSTTKSNELTVWEIYDTEKFMEFQSVNSDYVYTSNSEAFNPNPYYTTSKKETATIAGLK